jgi:hypothetical protein
MKSHKETFHGKFLINGKNYRGYITLDGSQTRATIFKDFNDETIPERQNRFSSQNVEAMFFSGNNKQVTLFQLIKTNVQDLFGSGEVEEKFFSHYITIGNKHIEYDKPVIESIEFEIKDLNTLFLGNASYSNSLELTTEQRILFHKHLKFKEPLEEGAMAWFWTGKTMLAKIDTDYGNITFQQYPSTSFSYTQGIHVDQKICMNLNFNESSSLEKVLQHCWSPLNFLKLVLGKDVEISNIKLHLQKEPSEDHAIPLELYICNADQFKPWFKNKKPDFGDLLLQPGIDISSFQKVVCCWLKDYNNISKSYFHLINNTIKTKIYSPERLITSATMFDILNAPYIDTTPEEVEADLEDLINEFRNNVKALKESPKRESVLNQVSLKRLQAPTLKSKVKQRLEVITKTNALPIKTDLRIVVDEAINLRNYYVHGSYSGKITLEECSNHAIFLTNTLEFIFIVSHFIECGWNAVDRFYSTGSQICLQPGHFVGEYMHQLLKNHEAFEKAIENCKNSP